VLSRNTTWTLGRDSALGLDFTGVTYYDGQGFLVRNDLGVASALELDGASVCVQSGTTTELNLADFFRSNNLTFEAVVFEQNDEAVAAYESGRCDAFTTDASGLYATRTKMAEPDVHVVLPEIISKEPLGPAVRQGDAQWKDVVSWTLHAMLNAEELGITSQNVDDMKANTQNPDVKRLLGVEGDFGQGLGVDNAWAYNVVKQVGNYGEIFEKNLGASSPLKIERGQNALWKDGGLQYGMPVR
jgi:general L-amino acid transport system substrate-binding protein